MKRFGIILTIFALLATICTLSAFPVFATPYEQIYLRDNGDLLSDAEEAALSEKLEAISRERECDVAVITVRTLGGRNVQRYAHELYDMHGYGQGTDRDGILLLISADDREYAFSVNGFANRSLNDKALDLLQRDAEKRLSRDDWTGAVEAFANDCDDLLELARAGKRYNPFPWIIIPISLIFGFVIAYFSVNSMKRKLTSVRLAGNAASYVRPNSLVLRDSRDIYLYSTVTRVPRPKSKQGGGSGGRSSGGRSSGGSRGGRSGRF